MKRPTTRRPRRVPTKATDTPPASVDTSDRTTCDGCERRATCGIDAPADPKQPGLFDADPPTLTIH